MNARDIPIASDITFTMRRCFSWKIVNGVYRETDDVLLLIVPPSYYVGGRVVIVRSQWAFIMGALVILDRRNRLTGIESLLRDHGFVQGPGRPSIAFPEFKRGQTGRIGPRNGSNYFFPVDEDIDSNAWRNEGDYYSWMPKLGWHKYLKTKCKPETLTDVMADIGFVPTS